MSTPSAASNRAIRSLDQRSFLGVKVSLVTVSQLDDWIVDCVHDSGKALVLNINAHMINLTRRLPWLKDFINSAEVVFCDGYGVIFGARILGTRIPERITYADWMWDLGALAESRGFTLFFLGGSPGVAEQAACCLVERSPGLRIAGIHHGFFDKSAGSAENEAVIRKINRAKPNILVVCFGMPLQEQWLMQNWHRIDANVALTGGGVFDQVSGNIPRCPPWMARNGLEWLGRLYFEPRRLWKRYLFGNPLFLWHVLVERIMHSAGR